MILLPEVQEFFWDEVGEVPNPTQLLIHQLGGRFVDIGGGERGGKSRTLARHLFTHCHFGDLFWIVGPDYDQARPEFTYCIEWLMELGELSKRDVSMPRKGAWFAEINRENMPGFAERKATHPFFAHVSPQTKIVTRTAAETLSLAAEAPGGVLIVEPGQIPDFETIRRLRGRVGEKRGWIWMGGTFERAADWLRDLWESWQGPNSWSGKSFSLPSWSNPAVYPGGRQDPEILELEAVYPPDLFMERFGGRPYKPEGLVIKEFNRLIHTDDVPVLADYPVAIAIDPGFNTAYSVLACQVVPFPSGDTGVHVVDAIYEHHKTVYEIIDIAKHRRWWPKVDGGVIDIAGTSHMANKSQAEVWQEETGLYLSSSYVYIEDGIVRHRNFLQTKRLLYDKDCPGLQEYNKWERDPVSKKPSVLNCDMMKAIQYFLIHTFGMVDYDAEELAASRRIESPFSF